MFPCWREPSNYDGCLGKWSWALLGSVPCFVSPVFTNFRCVSFVWVMRLTSIRLGALFFSCVDRQYRPKKMWRCLVWQHRLFDQTQGERQYRDELWDLRQYRASTEPWHWKTAAAPSNASDLDPVLVSRLTCGPSPWKCGSTAFRALTRPARECVTQSSAVRSRTTLSQTSQARARGSGP